MAFLVYNCGCKFRITEPGYTSDVRAEDCHGKLPKIYLSINPEEPESIHNINLDCQGVWDMIGRGDVKGIFQIEKDLGKTWSLKTQPRSIEDLSALISLIRPGCLKAYSGDPPKSMTQRYADRKMGEEPVTYLHQAIAECLKTTYGILTYQEQAMRIAEILAGFNKQEADVLRKAIGKKKADIMAKVEKEFLTKAEALGVVTLADAKEIFGWIRESQKYSFNKSHGITYAVDSAWSAFIKHHFPIAFYGAWIKGAMWKADTDEEVTELINDCKLHDIDVRIPELHSITPATTIINDEFIQFGAGEIKGVGDSFTLKMEEKLNFIRESTGKNLKDLNWLDFLIFGYKKLGKTTSEAFINIGVLDYLTPKISRTKMNYEVGILNKLSSTGSELEWLQANYKLNAWNSLADAFRSLKPVKKEGGGCSTAKRSEIIGSLITLLENPTSKMEDSIEWICNQEEHYLGTPITASKVDSCVDASVATMTCKDFLTSKGKRNEFISLAVEIVEVEHIVTKKGKTPGAKMAKVKIRDSSMGLNAVIFPKAFSQYGRLVQNGNTVLIIGERTKENNLSITQVKEIS